MRLVDLILVIPVVALPELARAGSAGSPKTAPAEVSVGGAEDLYVRYLGVGGFLLRRGQDVILTAPLYSNPDPFKFLGGPIVPNRKRIDCFHPCKPGGEPAPAAILVGHAHYDHLMDVPIVWDKTMRQRPDHEVRIYGSSTMKRILAGYRGAGGEFPPPEIVIDPNLVVALDAKLDSRNCALESWIDDPSQCGLPAGIKGDRETIPNARVQIYPLCAAHPRQVLRALHLWPGCLFVDRGSPPTRVEDYPEGPTFAYLIDFLDAQDKPAYRIYYQDTPSNGPVGRVPLDLIANRPVDVAILCGGNHEAVLDPEGLASEVRAKHVIIGHWEDFFRDQGKPITPAPTQSFHGYEERLRTELRAVGSRCQVHRPKPQDKFLFDRCGNLLDPRSGRVIETGALGTPQDQRP